MKPIVYQANIYSFFEEKNVEIRYFWNKKKAEKWFKELEEDEMYEGDEYEWGITELDIE